MTAGELTFVVFVFVLATSFWVFTDAPRYGMTKAWGIGSFFFWIIVFPLYLLVRSSQRRLPDGPVEQTAGQGPPPGWYVAPGGERRERWWDGQRWTEHERPS